ncbi:unnamed protein product [Trifolium pratense]|uniref:Uncharacterized protein n=1 Tax=Trifolium pratense TaxID=57577 RepID=A0ACB0JIZ5_TRIPR|nr:unnamed protein product [Trifolium pratense]
MRNCGGFLKIKFISLDFNAPTTTAVEPYFCIDYGDGSCLDWKKRSTFDAQNRFFVKQQSGAFASEQINSTISWCVIIHVLPLWRYYPPDDY